MLQGWRGRGPIGEESRQVERGIVRENLASSCSPEEHSQGREENFTPLSCGIQNSWVESAGTHRQQGQGLSVRAGMRHNVGRLRRQLGTREGHIARSDSERRTREVEGKGELHPGSPVGAHVELSSDDDFGILLPPSNDRMRLRRRRPWQSIDPQCDQQSGQVRALWGGSGGRRRLSWAASQGLGHLFSAPSSHGRVGPRSPTPGPALVPQQEHDHVQASKRQKGRKFMKNGNWSESQLMAAMAAVEQGSPVQTAALDYDIPRSTLRGHVMGLTLSKKRGRKLVLSVGEEEKVVKYIMGMARYGHPISITELKIKVAEATQLRQTPFKEGNPGAGWLRWFRKRHPEISLRTSQGLDSGRAKGLCPDHVSTFYENLEGLLAKDYEARHIWNCDESGAQAGRNGGGRVLAKTGIRSVHSIIPKEREWLSVLVCVNAAGFHIPNSTFSGVRAFNEIILSIVRTMLLWACKPKHG
jgi:hypothetical protein